jgi:hypothetical protein
MGEAVCGHRLNRKPSRAAGRSRSEMLLQGSPRLETNTRSNFQMQVADGVEYATALCRSSLTLAVSKLSFQTV